MYLVQHNIITLLILRSSNARRLAANGASTTDRDPEKDELFCAIAKAKPGNYSAMFAVAPNFRWKIRFVLSAVFILRIKLKNVSCEYNRLNG